MKDKKQAHGRKELPWNKRPIAYPKELPVSQRKKEIIQAIKDHQVVIISGETGSGKTTQIPKMCLDAGRGSKKRIACTQPRRVAALSVVRRVAEELKVDYGREVGSKIRFNDKTSRQTRVKFMTDGMLLSEAQSDPRMSEYDTIIVDEAHERSLNIDFLLGHLNLLRKERSDLKIIITSATIDIEKFSKAFDEAPVIEVSGRVYPVDVIYAPLDELREDSGEFTYIDGIAEAVERILEEFGNGDILAFLPAEKDIREAMDLLEGRHGKRLVILPCFGRLSNAEQQRIFAPSKSRRIILATNIAETSLTIPGIRFVIDTGLARISRYSPRSRTKRLPIENISQSSANQRKGRCGRVRDGICIRLYSENEFEKRREYSIPELQRANLAEVILRMKATRLGEVETFPFIDPPTPAAIKSGYQLLEELGALNKERELTTIGRKLAKLPVDPTVGRMLLQAEEEKVVEQCLVIASALSIQDPRERPLEKETQADLAHKRFINQHSDFLGLLNIWECYHDNFERLSQSRLRKFCKKHFISYLRMREWFEIHDQLKHAIADYERAANLAHSKFEYESEDQRIASRAYGGIEYTAIHRCLTTGLLANAARKEEANHYRASGNKKAMIFPGSGLFLKNLPRKGKKKEEGKTVSPEWILAGEYMETSRLYARNVAVADPAWFVQLGDHIIKRSYSDPIWDRKQGRVIAKESLRIHGLELQRKTVSYLKIDSVKATDIFIREALLSDDFECHHKFIDLNRKLKQRVQAAQVASKQQGWMAVEEAVYRFYAKRLENVASLADLNRFIKSNDPDGGALLMKEADLMVDEDQAVDLSGFPISIELENTALPIEYVYKPGEEEDGVTLKLPYSKAKSISGPLLDWLVPGHLQAKVEHLLRKLPKECRRKLAPISETAKTISGSIRPSRSTLVECLSSHLKNHYDIETYASDWDAETLPGHLKVRVEVHDNKGNRIAAGRDPRKLLKTLSEEEEKRSKGSNQELDAIWKKAKDQNEKRIESVDQIPDLPEKMEIGQFNGLPIVCYPGLRLIGEELKIYLFKDQSDAHSANRKATPRLIEKELKYELAWIKEDLQIFERLGPVAIAFSSIDEIKQDAYESMRNDLCNVFLDTLDKETFRETVSRAKEKSRGFAYKYFDAIKAILEKRQQMMVDPDLPPICRSELEQMLPKSFIKDSSHWALQRLPIYLEAICRRKLSIQQNRARDEERQNRVEHYRKRFKQLSSTERAKQSAYDLDELKWMIEEYALSLFAQDLGTAYPISEKRLEKRFSEMEMRSSGNQEFQKTPQKKIARDPKDKPTDKDLKDLKALFSK